MSAFVELWLVELHWRTDLDAEAQELERQAENKRMELQLSWHGMQVDAIGVFSHVYIDYAAAMGAGMGMRCKQQWELEWNAGSLRLREGPAALGGGPC